MSRDKRKIGVIVLISILAVLSDQLSKIIFSNILYLNQSLPILKNIFHLTLIHNTGVAFGMFKGNPKIILIITIIGIFLIIYTMRKDLSISQSQLSNGGLASIDKLAIGFILGGALGNFIDRVRLGYVIDFLDFRIWPVFNLADSFITVGAIILFCRLILPSKSYK